MELLGTFDVRYLVMNGYYPTEPSIIPTDYPQNFQHDFFSKQRGLNPVFSNGNSTVYEDEFWAPKIFQTNKYAIVVGGRETFTDLLQIKDFDLRRYALLWADQIVGEFGRDMFFHLLKGSDALIFVNSEPQDLVMLMLKNAIRFEAADFAFPSERSDSHWILRQSFTEKPLNIWGYFIISGRSAYTTGNVSTTRSMDITTSGEYEVWVRLLVGPDRGKLKISVDDVELGSVVPYATHYSGFVWRKVGTKDLTNGRHILSLDNCNSIYGNINDVDMIVLAKPETLQSEAESLIKMIEDMPAKEIYILEAQQMFKWIATKESYNWKTVELPFNGSNGYITSSQALGFETSAWTQLKYSLLRRGDYGVTLRAGIGPDYGSLKIIANGDEVRFMRFGLPDTEPVAPTVRGTFEWITLDPLTLELQNQISLSATGRVELDQLVIYSLSENTTTLNDYFKTTEAPPKVSYETISFTKFVAHIEASKPFFLALSVMYHRDWKAYLNGEEIESIPLYSWVNGFYLEKTGNYKVVLEFIGQRYVIYGWSISVATVVLFITYFLIEKINEQIRIKKLKRHVPLNLN